MSESEHFYHKIFQISHFGNISEKFRVNVGLLHNIKLLSYACAFYY